MGHRFLSRKVTGHRFLSAAGLALLPCVFACGASSPPATATSPSNGDGGADAAASSIAIAQSSVQRDPAAGIDPSALSAAVAANNAFAVDLYGRLLPAGASGNLWTSPISASLALTMTYAGAVGTTASEMATALHLGAGTASIFDGQNALSQALASRASAALADAMQSASGDPSSDAGPSPSDYQLQIVNSVWGEKTYPWEKPFLDTLAKNYGTGVYLEDFINQWEPARLAINGWVSDATADKINDLLPAGSLDDTTRMVLVNAIHLKLPWYQPFAASATTTGAFTRSDASTVTASFMNESRMLSFVDDGQAQVAALPLAGQQLELLVALPHGTLPAYEAALTAGSATLKHPTGFAEVQLSLPKVTFSSPTVSLKTALQAMGMTTAFERDAADFTGLCAHTPDGGRLYVEDVLQKATLAVQENGVEAAAATAVLVGEALAAETPVTMTVNRPYVVAILDAPTGAILFLGHVTDPTNVGSP